MLGFFFVFYFGFFVECFLAFFGFFGVLFWVFLGVFWVFFCVFFGPFYVCFLFFFSFRFFVFVRFYGVLWVTLVATTPGLENAVRPHAGNAGKRRYLRLVFGKLTLPFFTSLVK